MVGSRSSRIDMVTGYCNKKGFLSISWKAAHPDRDAVVPGSAIRLPAGLRDPLGQ
jgi:hypothetical protein